MTSWVAASFGRPKCCKKSTFSSRVDEPIRGRLTPPSFLLSASKFYKHNYKTGVGISWLV